MGGLWGSGSALELYLKEEGLKTLLFSGVNTDQVCYLLFHIADGILSHVLFAVCPRHTS